MIIDRTRQARDQDPRSPDAIRRRRGADLRLAPTAALAWLGVAAAITTRGFGVLATWSIVTVIASFGIYWARGRAWWQWQNKFAAALVSLFGALAASWFVIATATLRIFKIDRHPLAQSRQTATPIDQTYMLAGGIRKLGDGSVAAPVKIPGMGRTTVFISPEYITADLDRAQPGSLLHIVAETRPGKYVDIVPLTVSASQPVEVVSAPQGLRAVSASVRNIIRELAELAMVQEHGPWRWIDDSASLVPGMLIGDTSHMPQSTREAFLATGLSHLTAVSGLHVAIVASCALIIASLCGAGRKLRLVIVAVSILAFAGVVGPEPSIIRAGTMGLVSVVAVVSSRWSDSLSALAVAILGVTLFAPGLTVQYGFLLSVTATVAIIACAPRLGTWMTKRWLKYSLARWQRQPRAWEAIILRAVAVSLVADIATQPVIVWMVGVFSPTAVLANIVVGFAVAPLMVFGLIATLIAAALMVVGVSSTAAAYLLLPALVPARWITATAKILSQVPVIHTPDHWAWAVAWTIGLLLVILGAFGTIAWPIVPLLGGVVLVLIKLQIFSIGPYAIETKQWATDLSTIKTWRVAICGNGDKWHAVHPTTKAQSCQTPYGTATLPAATNDEPKTVVVGVDNEAAAQQITDAEIIIIENCETRRPSPRPNGTARGAIVHHPCSDGAGALTDHGWQITGNK